MKKKKTLVLVLLLMIMLLPINIITESINISFPTIHHLILTIESEDVESSNFESVEASIEEALADYNSLSDDERAIYKDEYNQLLELKDSVDIVKFREQNSTVLGLSIDMVEIDDKESIEAALRIHNTHNSMVQSALTQEQALLVSLLAEIAVLEEVEAYKLANNLELNFTTETIKIVDKNTIEEALLEYDLLSLEAQSKLESEKQLLDTLVAKIDVLIEVESFKNTHNEVLYLTVDTVTIRDKEKVQSGLTNSTKLTDHAQIEILAEKELLESLLLEIETLEDIDNFSSNHAVILTLTPSIVESSDKETIEQAIADYELLSDDAKAELVEEKELLDDLLNEVESLKYIEIFKIDHADTLSLTPATINMTDRVDVESAMADYYLLNNESQDELRTEKALLDGLLAEIIILEEVDAFVSAHLAVLELTPETVQISDEAAVVAAKVDYDKLRPCAQAKLSTEVAANGFALIDRIEVLKKIELFETAHTDVLDLTPVSIETTDRIAVEEAIADYNALVSLEAKAELIAEKALLDSLLAEIEILEEVKAFEIEHAAVLTETIATIESTDRVAVETAISDYNALVSLEAKAELIAEKALLDSLLAEIEILEDVEIFESTHALALAENISTIETTDKVAVVTAITEYDELSPEVKAELTTEKALLDSLLAEIIILEEVDVFISTHASVIALTPETVQISDEAAVGLAKVDYDLLSPEARAKLSTEVVTNGFALIDRIEVLKEIEAFELSSAVALALTPATVETLNKEIVEAAIADYNALVNIDSKTELIPEKALLDSLLAEIKILEDVELFESVHADTLTLTPATVETSNKAVVDSSIADYNELTPEVQIKLLSEKALLDSLLTEIEILEDVEIFELAHADTLTLTPATVETSNKAAVEAAIADYNALTKAEAKSRLIDEKSLLDDLLVKIQILESVEEFEATYADVLELTQVSVETTDRVGVEVAIADYNALVSLEVKAELASEKALLDSLLAEIEILEEVKAFEIEHAAVLTETPSTIESTDRVAVETAIADYNELGPEAQAELTLEKVLLDYLLAEIEILEDIEAFEATHALVLTETVATIETIDRVAVETAIADYNELNPEVKAELTTEKALLDSLLAEIEILESVQAFETTHALVLSETPSIIESTDRVAVETAIADYNALVSIEAQAKLAPEKVLLGSLLAEIEILEDIEDFETVNAVILNKTPVTIETTDRIAVETALDDYASLSDEAKSKILDEKVLLDSLLAEIKILEDVEAFESAHALILDKTPVTVETTDRVALDEAIADYNELIDEAKSKLLDEKALLDSLLTEIEILEDVEIFELAHADTLTLTPATVETSNKVAVETAIADYNALTKAEAKSRLIDEKSLLDDLLAEIEILEDVELFETAHTDVLNLTPVTVEALDRAVVEAAIADYNALESLDVKAELASEKALLDSLLDEIEILESIEAFEATHALVLAETPSTIESSDRVAVEAAISDYNVLGPEAQAELTLEKVLLDSLLAEIEILEDIEAFEATHALVLAETVATIETTDRAAVEAAIADYNALIKDEVKSRLATEKSLLDDLLAEIEIQEDVDTFESGHSIVLGLTTGNVESSDKAAVEAAIADYNELSEEAKSRLTDEKTLLYDLLSEIAVIDGVNDFKTDHAEALALTTATVHISDKDVVDTALTDYDALTGIEQTELAEEKSLLDDLLAKILILEEANTFTVSHSIVLDLTLITVGTSDKVAVETAITEYNSLSLEAQAELTTEKGLLDDLLAEIEILEDVEAYKSAYADTLALTPATVETTDKVDVEVAIAEYNGLTEEAKAKLTDEKALLDDLLAEIENQEKAEVFKVSNAVVLTLTPATVETLDRAAVESALADYDILADDVKVKLVTEKALLDSLLEEIEILEDVEVFKSNHSDTLAITPANVESLDRAAVEAAIADYNALGSLDAKTKLSDEIALLNDLLAKIEILEDAEAFELEHAVVLGKTPANVETTDRVAVEAAIDDYNELSAEAKAELSTEKALLDALLAEIEIHEEVEAFESAHSDTLALTPATVETSDKAAVETAIAAYNDLSLDVQAELITEKALLDALLVEIEIHEGVEAFEALHADTLALTPATVETSDRVAVEAAIAEFNALSVEEQAELTTEKDLLDSLLAEIEILEDAEQFKSDNGLILALTPINVETTDKVDVETAIMEYNSLSLEAQAEVTTEKVLLDALLVEIEILEDVETFESANAIILAKTPATIKTTDRVDVEAAIAEYNGLTEEAKAKLTTEKTLLDALLVEIEILETVEAFESNHSDTLALTPATVETTDKEAVEVAIAEYNGLAVEVQAELSAEKALLDDLLDEIEILEIVEAFKSNHSDTLAITPANVESSDRAAVEAAIADYNALGSLDAKTKLSDEIALLNDLLAKIEILEDAEAFELEHEVVLAKTPANVETTDRVSVEAGIDDYNELSVEAQAELSTEKALLDALLAEIEILEDVETFESAHADTLALTPATVESSDKAAVETAIDDYNELSAEAQSKLSAEKTLLDDLLAEIEILEDAEAFESIHAGTLALTPATVETSDRVAVETAIADYNELSAEAQAELLIEKALLDSILAEIEILEDAETFKSDNASILALTPITVEANDKAAVETALAEYSLLSEEAQGELATEKALLDALLVEIEILEDVEAFESAHADTLALTPATVETTDKVDVEAAIAEYSGLTEEAQIKLITEKTLLDALLVEIEILETVEAFESAHADTLVLTPATVETTDKAAVEAAIAEYNGLSAEEKAELIAEKLLLDDLLSEIEILEDVETFVFEHSDTLTLIPATVETTDKEAVVAAIADYNALGSSEVQAELIGEKALLDALLTEIEILEDVEAFVLNHLDTLTLTPATVETTDRLSVEAAIAEYNLLSPEAQSKLVPEKSLLDDLLAEIEVLEEIDSFESDHSDILVLTPATVETSNRVAVEAAIADYEALSADAQIDLSDEKLLLDDLLDQVIILKEIETFELDNFDTLIITLETVETSDKAAVEAAIADYNALVNLEAQAELASEKALLDSLLAEIEILEEVEAFESEHAAVLTENVSTIETTDRFAVETAIADYNELSSEIQAELTAEKALLDALLDEIESQESASVFEVDNAVALTLTPVLVETTDRAAIESALRDYDLLSEEAKSKLVAEKLLLDSLLEEIIILEEVELFMNTHASVIALTPETVQISDEAAVGLAKVDYDLLSPEARAKLSTEVVTNGFALIDRIDVLKEIETFDTDHTDTLVLTPATVKTIDRLAVETAIADYGLLSEDAQAELAPEKALLDSLLTEIEILEEVEAYKSANAIILAETPATIETTDRVTVEAAIANYNELTPEVQAELTTEKTLLDSLLAEIEILEDVEAYESANAIILAETPATIETTDRVSVETAIADYDSLSAEAKAELIAEKTLLDNLLEEIVILEEVEAFVDTHATVIALTPKTVQISDEAAVGLAMEDYDSLSEEAQAKLSTEVVSNGFALIDRIDVLKEIDAFETDHAAVLVKTPATVETTDRLAVETAITDYSLLSANAQAELMPEKALLDSLLLEIEVLEEIEDYVSANSATLALTPATVETTNRVAVEAALADYSSLSIAAQAELAVEKSLLDALLAEIEILEDVETFESAQALMLEKTPVTIETSDRAAVESALADYASLTDDAKSRILDEKALLDSLLAEIEVLEDVEAFESAHALMLEKTPVTIESLDRIAVESAQADYNSLTEEAKSRILDEKALLDSLLAKIEVLEDVEAFESAHALMLEKTPVTIESSDRVAVEAAIADYNALLKDEAKSKLADEKALLDSLLAEIDILDEVEAFESLHEQILEKTTVTVETTDRLAVETAIADYNALVNLEAKTELTPKKVLLDNLLAEIVILESIEDFESKHALALAETISTIESSDRAAVEAAIADYNILSIEAQAELTTEKALLDDLLAEIEVLEDVEDFESLHAAILLETTSTIETSDRATVEAAIADYNSLSAEAQAKLVTEKSLLDDLLAEIEILEDAETFISNHSATLALTINNVQISNKAAVEDAIADYDLLNEEAQSRLTAEKTLLYDLLGKIADLEGVNDFKTDHAEALALTTDNVQTTDRDVVEAALSDYDSLSGAEQAELASEKTLLDDLLAEIEVLEDAEKFKSDYSGILTLTTATVEISDKLVVEAAITDYNLLSTEAQAEVTTEKLLLDDLLAEIEVLEDVEDFESDNTEILALTTASVETSDKVAVEVAIADYDALTPEAKAKLTEAKQLLDDLLAEIESQEEAETFNSDHFGTLALTTASVETSDRAAVEAAIAEYDLLDDDVKVKLVTEKTLLDDLLAEIKVLEDVETFETNHAIILAKTPASVETSDRLAVETAISEYNALTPEARAKLTLEKALLDDLLVEIEIHEDVEAFESSNSDILAETPATVETSDRVVVETALAEFNSLDLEVQAELTTEKALLDALLAEIEIHEDVEAFESSNSDILAETPATVETTDRLAVETAIAEFNLLSVDAQAELTTEKALLDALLSEIEIHEGVEAFESNHSATLALTPATVEISDRLAVETALDEYNSLSAEEKAELTTEKALLDSLLAEIVILEEVETFETDNAAVLTLTPATVESSDRLAVEAAIADYNLLSLEAQAELTAEKLLLDDLLAEIEVLEDAEAFESDYSAVLLLTPATVETTDRLAVEAAIAAYNSLSAEAQAELTIEKALLDSLLNEIDILEDAEAFETDNAVVLALTPVTVETTDRLAIEAAIADYDALTPEAQAKLTAEKTLLDDLLEEIVVLEAVEAFETNHSGVLSLTPATVDTTDRVAVEAAIAAYNSLSAEAQAELIAEKALLDDLLAEIDILDEVEAFESNYSESLALTPATVETTDRLAVEAAIAAYNSLTAEAQANLSAEKILLDNLLAEIDILDEVEAFESNYADTLALTPASVEITDKADVEAAIAEYNSLTAEVQAELATEKALLDSLLNEIEILEDAETFISNHSATLALTPISVVTSDRAAVEAALAEFNSLSAEAQAKLTAEKALLDSLLEEITIMEHVDAFKLDHAESLALTPENVETLDKTVVEAALADYELLCDEAKTELITEKALLDSLLVEINAIEDSEGFIDDHSSVLALTIDSVVVSDKAAVEAAIFDYAFLSDEAKSKLTTEIALLQDLLTEIIAWENSEFLDFEGFTESSLATKEIVFNGRTWFISSVAIDCNSRYDVCIDTRSLALKTGAYFESVDPFENGIDKIELYTGALRIDSGASFAFRIEYELQSNPGVWLILQENGSDKIFEVLSGDPLGYMEIDINILESVNIRFVPINSNRSYYINLDNIVIFKHVDETSP